MWLLIIIRLVCVVLLLAFLRHQRKLRLRAHLLCFSMSNAEFSGTSGALVNMTLQADGNASADAKVGQIKSQVFTETNGNQVKWENVPFIITTMLKGDVDGDGKVTAQDASLILQYVAGKITW